MAGDSTGVPAADGDTGECTLCDLPVGEDPVTAADVEGSFCCQGCLSVARRLDDVDVTGDPPSALESSVDATAASDTGEGTTPARDATDGATPTDDASDAAGAVETGDSAGAEAFLTVDGMHCSTCEAFLETRATDRDGVAAADASYASDLMRIVYDPDEIGPDVLPDLVGGLGYDASLVEDAGDAAPAETEQETLGRLVVGAIFGMLVMLWYVLFLYPTYLGVDPDALLLDLDGVAGTYLLANIWVMSTIVLAYTGYPILRGAYVSLRSDQPNMDLLVALAAVTAYGYSTLALALGHREVYFDVTVVVVFAVTVGTYYEGRIKDRATGALSDLTSQRVDTARRRSDEGTESVPLSDVSAGDELVVRAGERVPLDGEVVEGTGAVDEALVTGESLPVTKRPGDDVVGGAELVEGGIVVAVDEDERNTLDRIARRLWTVQSGRRGVQRLADRIAVVFVPLVVVLAVLATAVHLALGATTTGALLTGLAVLVVSCPCALGLATPLSIAAGLRAALSKGIVVTDASLFERARDVDVVGFDKTGTLTTGDLTLSGRPDADLLADAASVEAFADHPLANAIVAAAEDRDDVAAPGERDVPVEDVELESGRGIAGAVDDRRVLVGHPDLFDARGWTVDEDLRTAFEREREDAKVAALAGRDGRAEAVLTAADEPRENWERVVSDLADGREVVVITGDDGAAAERFRECEVIDEVFGGVPPEGKGEVVERLRARGTVAMVGDGSNDAPALAAADVGIALADGTALAVEAADAVVTAGDLDAVPTVFEVTRATRRRLRQNVGWAFCYNAVAVPAAFVGLLSPLVAALAMATSSLLVVSNAARSLGE